MSIFKRNKPIYYNLSKVRQICFRAFGDDYTKINYASNKYRMITKGELQKFLDRDKTDEFNFTDNFRCCHFAVSVWGALVKRHGAVGIGYLVTQIGKNRHRDLFWINPADELIYTVKTQIDGIVLYSHTGEIILGDII